MISIPNSLGVIVALGVCLSVQQAPSNYAPPGDVPISDIQRIELSVRAHHIVITRQLATLRLEATGREPVERSGKMNVYEYGRITRLIEESKLFRRDEDVLLAGGAHAGNATVFVEYDDTSYSRVEHHSFNTIKEPLSFWAIVRAIEGSVHHAVVAEPAR